MLFPASGHPRGGRVREELSPGLQTGAGPDKHGLRRVLARMRGSQVLPPRGDTLHGVRHLLSGSLWCRLLVALCWSVYVVLEIKGQFTVDEAIDIAFDLVVVLCE